MRIVFFGTPDYIEPIISALDKNFKLLQAFRSPKQLNNLPAGRQGETIEQLKSLETDLFVVASFGKIFSNEFLGIPKYGAINIHPSELPKYKGPSPLQTQILEGVKKSAVTFIRMDEEVDHGHVIEQIPFEIKEFDTFESAATAAFELAAQHIPKVISNYIKEPTKLAPQDHSKATYTKVLTKQDGYIDLEKVPSDLLEIRNWKLEIARKVRAFYPWPGVWFKTILNGKEQIIKLLPERKIQVEGKNPMTYKDFLNGYQEGKEILRKLNLE